MNKTLKVRVFLKHPLFKTDGLGKNIVAFEQAVERGCGLDSQRQAIAITKIR